jgi:hypothetical protein
MMPKRTDNATRSGGALNRPLPVQLAKALKPEMQRPLMHGVRRRILRTFNQDPTPRTTKDLQKTFPNLSFSSVNYHVLVLDECGCLAVSRVKATPDAFLACSFRTLPAIRSLKRLCGRPSRWTMFVD